MAQLTTAQLIAGAKAQAKELCKSPDHRSEDLEDEAIAWTLMELAKRLTKLEVKVQKLNPSLRSIS